MNVVASSSFATPATAGRYGRVLSAALSGDLGSMRRQPGEHSTRHTLLSLYTELPAGNISIEEFEALALDRLRGEKSTFGGCVGAPRSRARP